MTEIKSMGYLTKKIDKVDWECIDADTQYLTHGIHRYSGKFIPQIARNAIEVTTKKNDLVLDLYVGSGTTLLEASMLQRKSIGVDLSPLAILISKVKTTPIKKDKLHKWFIGFVDLIQDYEAGGNLSFFDNIQRKIDKKDVENDPRLNDAWYTKWFQKNILRELIWIDLNINQIADKKIQSLAILTLSDILRKSSNAHGSYPNVMFDKNKKNVSSAIPKYVRRLKEIVASVGELDSVVKKDYIPKIFECNNKCLSLEANSIDAIITHPPYIGSIPYAEYGILSLTWFGESAKMLDANLTGGQRQRKNVVERFNDDYAAMFKEAYRTLKRGKYMFILIGNPTVRGEKIDLAGTSVRCALEAKFKLDTKISRKGVNRRANLMGEESILFFRKG